MIHTVGNCRDKVLVDASGRPVSTAYEFNDETNETSLYVLSKDGRILVDSDKKPVTTKVIIKGAKLIDRGDLK